MLKTANKLDKLFIIFPLLMLASCDLNESVFINDTNQRILIKFDKVGKCNPGNDYLNGYGEGVSLNCNISILDDITLTYENGSNCYVDMADFRKKIITKPAGNAFRDVYYEIRLSQIKCIK